MKRLALAVLICLLAPAAFAAGAQNIDGLRRAAETFVAASAPAGSRVQADAIDERMRLPGCAAPLSTATSGSPGGARATVAVSCAAPQAWTVYVPVRISRSATVAVAARNLPAGSLLATADLRLETRDTSGLAQGYVADPALVAGQMLAQPVAAGAVITPAALKAAAAIRRGDLVTLVSRSGGFEVRSQGRALANGAIGERLAVENSGSRRVVQGQVTSDGLVEIGL